MLGKRTRPAISISKIAGALRSAGFVDSSTSPRSTLDCNMQSPRSPKYYDQQGGVGLGIVVALNNNSNNSNSSKSGGEILAKYTLYGQFSCRSNPIPMIKSSGTTTPNSREYEYEVKDNMIEEEFTYVTCHGPKKSTSTRVYYNGTEYSHVMGRSINHNMGVFNISSPTTLFDDRCNDFLSSCHLCRKTLHGKDIYMYRGEKAFCSEECRQKQIRIDERKEKCRSNNISSSPYSYTTRGGQIFSTGIIAV